MINRLILIMLVLLSVGCASVPMADPALDQQAKQFQPSPDSAGVYIYRNEVLGAAITLGLSVDGKSIGKTASKTYFYLELPEGEHRISSSGETSSELNLNAVNGNLYYIWQEVKMGAFTPGSKLQLVSEEVGQNAVLECKLAATLP